jgi:hypothetical protein
LVHGLATLELAGGFGMPLDTDESFHYLANLLIDGFENRLRQKSGRRKV